MEWTAASASDQESGRSVGDYELDGVLGTGAAATVSRCYRRNDASKTRYALKQVVRTRPEQGNRDPGNTAEREALMLAAQQGNPWVVRLHDIFEDDENVNLVLEYMPGGDLVTWLYDKQRFSLDATRFYIAELCAAVASVHNMQYVHRDVKPGNILFGADGHIKLGDFGLAKRFGRSQNKAAPCRGFPRKMSSPIHTAESQREAGIMARRSRGSPETDSLKCKRFTSIVGTVAYAAPEMCAGERYGVNCDWWSVGVIMYEMLYDALPFHSENPIEVCDMIVHWREQLAFPEDPRVSADAVDFLKHLLCDADARMRYEQIRAHPFIRDLDLDRLRETQAAYVPKLSDPLDKRYFRNRKREDDTNPPPQPKA